MAAVVLIHSLIPPANVYGVFAMYGHHFRYYGYKMLVNMTEEIPAALEFPF